MPTALLFIVLVMAYQFLVQGPLTATLESAAPSPKAPWKTRTRRLPRPKPRPPSMPTKLRQARAEVYKVREQRVKQWNAERDAALDAARKAAALKVSQAKAELEAEAASARQTIQASAADLAGQVVRAVLPLAAGGSR